MGTALVVLACTVTVCPDKPLAAANMQALSKLVEGDPGSEPHAVAVPAGDPHQTPLVPHVKLPGEDFMAARTAATAAPSAAA